MKIRYLKYCRCKNKWASTCLKVISHVMASCSRNVFRTNQVTYLIKSKIFFMTFNLYNTHSIVVIWLCRAALTSDNTMWHLRVISWTAAVAQTPLNPSNHVANSRAGGGWGGAAFCWTNYNKLQKHTLKMSCFSYGEQNGILWCTLDAH